MSCEYWAADSDWTLYYHYISAEYKVVIAFLSISSRFWAALNANTEFRYDPNERRNLNNHDGATSGCVRANFAESPKLSLRRRFLLGSIELSHNIRRVFGDLSPKRTSGHFGEYRLYFMPMRVSFQHGECSQFA
jgi:hypothetical protein